MAKKLSWKFPSKKFQFMRVEIAFIAVLAVLVFLFSFMQTDNRWFWAVISTLLFLGLYVLISTMVQKVRQAEEHYQLTKTHLHLTRKRKNKVQKIKVPLSDITHHKLDKTFLGGYVVTKKKNKHPLFFNTRKELEEFEKFLKKHLKK